MVETVGARKRASQSRGPLRPDGRLVVPGAGRVGVSNVARGRRLKCRDAKLDTTSVRDEPDDLTSAERRARRRAWAQLLRRVYEISPLTCPKCGAALKIIRVVLDPAAIERILDHIRTKKDAASRAPPEVQSSLAAVS
jgi:hypothetical protein